MKLNILLKREPFEFIFKKTVESYLKAKFNWNGEIKVENKLRSRSSFLLNSYLNIIFPSNISESSLKIFINEHLYDKNLFKRILRKIYLYFSISIHTRYFFSSRILSLTKYKKRFDEFVFLGGNNSIKIIDLKNKNCIVLKKYEFDPKFFNQALDIRILYSHLIGNTITDYDKNDYWYKELLLEGIPLDRQRSDLYSARALNIAKENMKQIYKVSTRYYKFEPYINNIIKKINQEINNLNNNYKNNFRNNLFEFVDVIRKYLITQNYKKLYIPIATSHGDFNKGNIVFSRSKNYVNIIDWEYSDKRVIWYDSFYLALNASNPYGISKRINNLKKYKNDDFQRLFWLDNLEVFSFEREFFIKIFILESLLNRLIQCNVSYYVKKDIGIYIFLNELEKLF